MNNISAAWIPSTTSFPNTKPPVFPCDISRNFGFILSVITFNGAMAFFAFWMNVLIIITIVGTSSVRSLPSNVLILGLAISDLLVGAVVQPLFCVLLVVELKLGYGAEISRTISEIFKYMSYQLASISFLTLSAITADRFLAVQLHLRYQELVTTRRYGIALACIWLSTLSVFLQGILTIHVYRIITTIVLFIVIIIDLYMVLNISRVIRRHSLQIQAQQQSVQQSIDMPRYKKSVNTMYYVIAAYLLCYMPLLGIWLLQLINNFNDGSRCALSSFIYSTSLVSTTLVLSNSIINPIIYCWRIQEIRDATKKLIRDARRQLEDQ